MNNYWTREKREEWQRYFEEQEAFHGGVKESKSAPMSIGEVRRALATVDALEKGYDYIGVGVIVRSDAPATHSWVMHADDAELNAAGIVWCQYCGQHRVELPATEYFTADCPAIVHVRALLAALEGKS